ncbi:CBS domain-containing protein [Streptomyces sp. NPDC055287]
MRVRRAAARDRHARSAGAGRERRARLGQSPGPDRGRAHEHPAFTARADWTIPRAARELRRRHIKQLPVVGDDGLLTGIVSRSDLLDAFIRTDAEIRAEVEQDVLGRILGLDEGTVAVEVRDGAVTLRGQIPEPGLLPVIVALSQGIDGVVAVDTHLTAAQASGLPCAPNPGGVSPPNRSTKSWKADAWQKGPDPLGTGPF